MSHRAFTILELALATVVASAVMLLAMGLISLVTRSQVNLSDRTEQTADMQRVRLVMSRAFSNLLVAPPQTLASKNAARVAPINLNKPATAALDGGKPGATASPTPVAPATPAFSASVGSDPDDVLSDDPAPRFWLDFDGALGNTTLEHTGVEGSRIRVSPQRLELVVTDSPVPSDARDAFQTARQLRARAERMGMYRKKAPLASAKNASAAGENEQEDTPVAQQGSEETPEDDEQVRAIRGVFELRPQPVPAGVVRRESEPARYELWWTTLPLTRSAASVAERFTGVAAAGGLRNEFRIARNVVSMRCRAFEDRSFKTRYAATIASQLPAYVEVELRMATGLAAQWLFEVSWATGPELRVNPDQQQGRARATGQLDAALPDDARATPQSGRGKPSLATPVQGSPQSTPRTARPTMTPKGKQGGGK